MYVSKYGNMCMCLKTKRGRTVKTILFESQKGGVGKTTLSTHLAVKLSEEYNVGIIDLDPQGSMTAWHKARESQHGLKEPFYIKLQGTIEETLKRCEKAGLDFVVMDSAPNKINTEDFINMADLIFIPLKASPHDVRTLPETMKLIKDPSKAFFILNDVRGKTRMAWETLTTLSEYGQVVTTIHSRVNFAECQIDGKTVNENEPNSKSANEINQIYNFVIRKLKPVVTAKEAA